MLKRILISAVILPLFLGLMFFQPPVYFRLFSTIALFIGFMEYRGIMHQKGLFIHPWPGVAMLFILLVPLTLEGLEPFSPFLAKPGALTMTQAIAILLVVLGTASVMTEDLEKGLLRFFAELAGPLYIGILGLHVLLLHRLVQGSWWVFLVFWYSWVYDAGALFIGKPFGRHKFNALSPSKTWEGFWGGIAICALLSGLLLPFILPKDFPLSRTLLVAFSLPACLLAQAGDLFESMLKRHAGVKDSSHLISAHGGFLDKLDSSLFVAPFIYLVATLLGVK